MPRLTKIYTRKGDHGGTMLGGGQPIDKDHLRIESFGNVDELNSVLGVVRACEIDPRLAEMLTLIQNDLFHLGSDLCMLEEDKQKYAVPQIEPRHIEQLESFIDELQAKQPDLENFILPAGTLASSQLQVARCVCRRAERSVVAVSREESIGAFVGPYLNRLSDLLFVMARHENLRLDVPEVLWDSHA